MMTPQMIVEPLEARDLPSGFLEIGDQETFTFHDADGDAVHVQISGSQGQLQLLENRRDGLGNDDGVLEDGENIGQILVSMPSPDFAVHITAEATGDGNVALGHVVASDDVIRGLFADGSVTFELKSYTGWGFAVGGGLFVDTVLEKIILTRLAESAAIEVTGDLHGSFVVKDDLAGTLNIGGHWHGDVIIGEGVTGTITVGGDVAASARILGNVDANIAVGGDVTQTWLIVGSMGGLFDVTGDISQLRVINDVTGVVQAGGTLRIDVGGSVTETATLSGHHLDAKVGKHFSGSFVAAADSSLHVAETIFHTAEIAGAGHLTIRYGTALSNDATITAADATLIRRPNEARGQIINVLPFVIRTSGLYRLARNLDYAGSSGAAIVVETDHVTIDLQGYTLRNTAGAMTDAIGILGQDLEDVMVTGGTIEGFRVGVQLSGQASRAHRVQYLRAVANWYFGLWIEGAGNLIRHNVVLDTGGLAVPGWTVVVAMRVVGTSSRVENNIIYGTHRSQHNIEWVGIHFDAAPSSTFKGNVVASRQTTTISWGMWVNAGNWPGAGSTVLVVEDNLFSNLETTGSFIHAATGTFADNVELDAIHHFNQGKVEDGNFYWTRDALPGPYLDPVDLRREFGFYFDRSFFVNDLRHFEKWFRDRNLRWFALFPDGSLYLWDDQSLDTSPRIGLVDPVFWTDPHELLNTPITLPADMQQTVGALQRDYHFYDTGQFYFNALSAGDKWFRDRLDRWFILLPDGTLLQSDGQGLATSEIIAVLDPVIFDEPWLLFDTPALPVEDMAAHLTRLRREYGFHAGQSFNENAFGYGEKWFQDRRGRWFALTPDGTLYYWTGARRLLGNVFSVLEPAVFDNPALLFEANVDLPDALFDALSNLQHAHRFRFAGSYFENWFGYQEKWFQDRRQQWHMLTPDGTLHRWTGVRWQLGDEITTVDPLVYDDPTMLFEAEVTLSKEQQNRLSELRYQNGFHSTGTHNDNAFGQHEKWFQDRHGEWFVLTADGELYRWEGVRGQFGTLIEALDPLVFDDPQLLFAAPVELPEAARDIVIALREEYGFHFTGSHNDNSFGFREKWFQDRNDDWFTLTPDGIVYRWMDILGELGEEIARLDPFVYDELAWLFEELS